MNSNKTLKIILGLEVSCLALVPLFFKYIEPKKIAGLVAGSLFLSLGLLCLYYIFRSKRTKNVFFIIFSLVHLFVISIPMLVTRIINFTTDFSELRILGMQAQEFHSLSHLTFTALILASVAEFYLLKKAKPQSES